MTQKARLRFNILSTEVADRSNNNMFELNATKCKELRINFLKQKSDVDPACKIK